MNPFEVCDLRYPLQHACLVPLCEGDGAVSGELHGGPIGVSDVSWSLVRAIPVSKVEPSGEVLRRPWRKPAVVGDHHRKDHSTLVTAVKVCRRT